MHGRPESSIDGLPLLYQLILVQSVYETRLDFGAAAPLVSDHPLLQEFPVVDGARVERLYERFMAVVVDSKVKREPGEAEATPKSEPSEPSELETPAPEAPPSPEIPPHLAHIDPSTATPLQRLDILVHKLYSSYVAQLAEQIEADKRDFSAVLSSLDL